MTETFKVVLLGDTNVGKTSILQRYAKDTFRVDLDTTVGPQFMSKLVSIDGTDSTLKLQIWDTAGQEKYRSVAPIYYRDASAAICVFDVTNKLSLEAAEKFVADLRQYAPSHLILALAGNKCDMYDKEEVTIEEGQDFRRQHSIEIFQQTSAKENTGIDELFQKIAKRINENKEVIR